MDCSVCGQSGAFTTEVIYWELRPSIENCSEADGCYHPFCLACKAIKESTKREITCKPISRAFSTRGSVRPRLSPPQRPHLSRVRLPSGRGGVPAFCSL